jgi:hypothetical protein
MLRERALALSFLANSRTRLQDADLVYQYKSTNADVALPLSFVVNSRTRLEDAVDIAEKRLKP